jgi:hypothetical protein
VAAISDAELNDYRLLLQELKALMPAEAPKVINGIVARRRWRHRLGSKVEGAELLPGDAPKVDGRRDREATQTLTADLRTFFEIVGLLA